MKELLKADLYWDDGTIETLDQIGSCSSTGYFQNILGTDFYCSVYTICNARITTKKSVSKEKKEFTDDNQHIYCITYAYSADVNNDSYIELPCSKKFYGVILNFSANERCVFHNEVTNEILVIPYGYVESILPIKEYPNKCYKEGNNNENN